jgi:ethanolamine ammonia-lyase small subunit
MNEWERLRKFTEARIGLGRTGYAVPTREALQFQLDHARARDAIHWRWERTEFEKSLRAAKIPAVVLETNVRDRAQYLMRPDYGRVLSPSSRRLLADKFPKKKRSFDIVIAVSDGLSSSAAHAHAAKFVTRLWKELKRADYRLAPLFLLENARVAVSDEIGALTGAKLSIIVLGERPGLTSVDSLAMYMTYGPRVGNTDALRNCVSNIRPPTGLSYAAAVKKTLFLVREAFRRQLSGVELKEETGFLPARTV